MQTLGLEIPLLTPLRKKRPADDSSELNESEVNDTELDVNDTEVDGDTVHMYPKQSSLAKFFHVPTPPAKKSAPPKLPSCKVLTSLEHLRVLDEKAKLKQEQEKLKEQRKLERERKAAEKKLERERKAAEKKENKRTGKTGKSGSKRVTPAVISKWLFADYL